MFQGPLNIIATSLQTGNVLLMRSAGSQLVMGPSVCGTERSSEETGRGEVMG